MMESPQPAPVSPSASFPCPHCQSAITYYDVSGSSFYGCPVCRTYCQYETEGEPRSITTFQQHALPTYLPVGAEGYLNGEFVRVTGSIQKREAGTTYYWGEYMLLRKDGSYWQLAEYQGHWMVIEPTRKSYQEYHGAGKAYYIRSSSRYRLFNRYKPEVISAIGEFDWNVLDDNALTVSEYINPPAMLMDEYDGRQSKWYKGQYITRTALATAFGLKPNELPIAYGVGAIEPPNADGRLEASLWVTGLAAGVLIVLLALISLLKPHQQLFTQSYSTQADSAGTLKPIVTRPFEVNGPAALSFRLSAELNNEWLEVGISLVNERTGRMYEFTKSLEHYYGVESGESWSEGNASDEAILSRIPSGSYHLTIYPARAPGLRIPFTVSVYQNPLLTSNFILLLGLLLLYPVGVYIHKQSFEQRRWSNSDYGDE